MPCRRQLPKPRALPQLSVGGAIRRAVQHVGSARSAGPPSPGPPRATRPTAHPTPSPARQVDEFVQGEAEGLRAKAEEAKEELDKLADLQNLKAEVAFNSALAGRRGATRFGKLCRSPKPR